MSFVHLNAARRDYVIASKNLELARRLGASTAREAEVVVCTCLDRIAIIQSTLTVLDARL
jgi:hypothetical protein